MRIVSWTMAVSLPLLFVSCVSAQEAAIPDYSQAERSEVPEALRWRVEDIYADEQAWRADLDRAGRDLDTLGAMVPAWTSSPQRMADFLERYEALSRLESKVCLWPSLQQQTHVTNARFQDFDSEASQFSVDFAARTAPMDAAIIALGRGGIDAALRAEPRLSPYRALLEEALRNKDHTLPDAAAEVVAGVDLFADGPGTAASCLLSLDLPRAEVVLPDGSRLLLDRASRDRLLHSRDAGERRAAHAASAANRKRFANTFAALIDMSVKRDLFRARTHRFPDCLSAELFPYDVDPAIYRNLVQTVRSHLDPYHRYLRLRARILGLKEFHPYDQFLPLAPDVNLKFPFADARALIEEAVAPIGPAYAARARHAFDSGWLDVYSHKDKVGAGSATSAYGVHPYVLLSYGGDFFDFITVAHELGHALAFDLAERAQPFATAQGSWFLSEVPSTLNETLLMHHLADRPGDDRTRLALLAEFIDRIGALLFLSTQGAEFELAIHEQVEKGGTLSAAWLDSTQLALTRHYYGQAQGAMIVDDYMQSQWIHSNLWFAPFQSYFYVVGVITSLALADEILGDGGDGGRKYQAFLEAGSSRPAAALLKEAGVDLSSPEPILRALRVYDKLLDRLEATQDQLDARAR